MSAFTRRYAWPESVVVVAAAVGGIWFFEWVKQHWLLEVAVAFIIFLFARFALSLWRLP